MTPAAGGLAPDSDLIVFQANALEDLERIRELTESLKPNGGIWLVAPKGGPGTARDPVLEAGKRAGLVDVKVARSIRRVRETYSKRMRVEERRDEIETRALAVFLWFFISFWSLGIYEIALGRLARNFHDLGRRL